MPGPGRTGQFNGVMRNLVCPFCGALYGVTNMSKMLPAPPGAQGINPNDPNRAGVGWSPHTIACWRRKAAKGES